MVRWVSKTQEEQKWHDGEKIFASARMVAGELFCTGMSLDAAPYLQVCCTFTTDLPDGAGSFAAESD